MTPYRCPVCLGGGSEPPESVTQRPCHACSGKGIVWGPPPTVEEMIQRDLKAEVRKHDERMEQEFYRPMMFPFVRCPHCKEGESHTCLKRVCRCVVCMRLARHPDAGMRAAVPELVKELSDEEFSHLGDLYAAQRRGRTE